MHFTNITDIDLTFWEIEEEIKKLDNEEIETCWVFSYGDAYDDGYDPETSKGQEYIIRHAYEIAACRENEIAEQFFGSIKLETK